MASRSGTASRLTLALTQLALAAALVACGTENPTATAITAQPVEQSVVVNGTARFVLNATGDGLKFQWQRSTNNGSTWANVVGATQAVLEIANVTADQDGHLYRAQVSGDDGTVVVTSAVALHCDPVVVAPRFTVNLASPAEITEGADITLAVTAAGTSLTYRWETSPAGSSSWSALSGNNSPQLLLNDVPLSDNGRRYRVTISNSAGSVTSQVATLGVKAEPVTPTAPTVTTQPAAVSVKAPAAATFSVAVSGNPTPTVQWQTSATNSSNPADWTDISGANDLTYRIASTTNGLSGYYRAKVSNSVDTAYSQAAKLTVTDADVAPKITTQPANQTVTVGAQATFTVAASGTPTPTIQWQVSSNGGSTWANITGANSATYSFTTSAVGTSQYRAVASNGVGTAANSNAATLTVNALASKLSGRSWTKGFPVEGVNDNASVQTYAATIDDEGRSTIIYVKSNGSRNVLYAVRGTPNASGVDPTFTTVELDTARPVSEGSSRVFDRTLGIKASPSGNVVATWVSVEPCNSSSYTTNARQSYCFYRYASRLMAGSSSWETPVLVASTPDTALGTVAINDAGDLLIEVQGWERYGTDSHTTSAVKATLTWKANAAGAFSQHLIKDNLETSWFPPRQALDSKGNLLLVGQVSQNGTDDIVAYRGKVTTSIGAKEVLDTRGAEATFRALFVGRNGQAVVMWNQNNGTSDKRFAATLDNPTGSWSAPTELSLKNEACCDAYGYEAYPFYGTVTDSGDFILYRNGWRVRRTGGAWGDYVKFTGWDYWNYNFSGVALNRDGSALVGGFGSYGTRSSWASFDGPAQALIQALPGSGVSSGSGFIFGVEVQSLNGKILLAKNGIGLFVNLNTYDVLPSPTSPAGDKRSVNQLWALYFK